jgi:uncharacterized protein YeaO (DUF488 family)
VPREEWAARDFFDLWFPNLAPTEALLEDSFPIADDRAWRTFRRRFLAELGSPPARRDLALLAALSHRTDFAIGCYCAEEAHCHRSLLRELLAGLGAAIAAT